MTVYRITFHTKGFFRQHFDATAEKATHYHVLKNNRKIGESSKLYQAVKVILDDTGGENEELQKLMERAFFLRQHDPYYQCVGILYMEKYGVKIEMKFNESPCKETV